MLPSEQLISEAAEWFARIHDPDQPSNTREEFTRWVLQSPAHIAAFLKVTRSWGDIGLAGENMPSLEDLVVTARASVDQLSNVIGLPSNVIALPSFVPASEPDEPKRKNWLRRNWKSVAAVAATVVISIPIGWLAIDHWLNPSHIRTAVGEQRSVALPDGSLVQLNTNSELRIDLRPHERRVVLERGEARFTVAKDPSRPFLVKTPQATVRALGTIFNVQIAPQGGTDVAVLEGHVQVISRSGEPGAQPAPSVSPRLDSAASARAAHTEIVNGRKPGSKSSVGTQQLTLPALVLGTGEQAAVTPEGKILPDVGPPLERVVGWTDRRLVFREETLATLIAEVNRYHEKPIRIIDPEIAALRISGTFAAYDLPSLIQYLERYRGVRTEISADGGMELYKAE